VKHIEPSVPLLSATDLAPRPLPAARLVGATKRYERAGGAVCALRDVTVAFDAGRFTAIMGPSGSGKSTLMHCLAGLDRLSSGQAFLGDRELSTMGERELTRFRRSQLGFVFQSFNLVSSLSAYDNITLPLSLAGQAIDRAYVERVVSMLGLDGRLHHRPSELSGGQQQRVAVARALVARPRLIVADEPTGNLDSVTGKEILGFLRQAVDDDCQSVVMVTHDPTAAAWADRVVVVVDGQVHGDLIQPTLEEIMFTMTALGRR
jgi:putative ABC transport system ATP-binding protein